MLTNEQINEYIDEVLTRNKDRYDPTLQEDDQSSAWVHQYAIEIFRKERVACNLIWMSCRRHLEDLYRSEFEDFPYYFDDAAAQGIVSFTTLIKHTKGRLARQSLTLMPYQIFMSGSLIGWKKKADNYRRFRTANIWQARKNGKSLWSTSLALYFLVADGETGAEVYTVATKADQARIVYNDCMLIANMSDLKNILKIGEQSIKYIDEMAIMKALPNDSKTLDGLNVHLVICDELHEWRDRNTWNVMETSTGAREQSLLISISTAGFVLDGVAMDLWQYGLLTLKSTWEDRDETLFTMNYTIDDGDKFDDPTVWIKANPALGVAKKFDDMERLSHKAKAIPSDRPLYLTKHCNVFVNSSEIWLDIEKTRKCRDTSLDIANYKGRECYVSLDFAEYTDICSFAILFPENDGTFAVFYENYLPYTALDKVSEQQKQRYHSLDDEGYLNILSSEIISTELVEDVLTRLVADYKVTQIAYDPYHVSQVMHKLEGSGKRFPVVAITQTKANLSEASKLLEAYIENGSFKYNGDKCFEWCSTNAIAKQDDFGNIRVTRVNTHTDKIDPVVATIIALSVAEIQEKPTISPYRERGFRILY